MSIYATLGFFQMENPNRHPDQWIKIWIQGVPPHIGWDEEGKNIDDYYSSFLPPPVKPDGDEMRAVIFVAENWMKKDIQKYVNALLTLTHKEYMNIKFIDLWEILYEKINLLLENPSP